MKMKIEILNSPHVQNELLSSLVEETIKQYSEIADIYKEIIVLIADEDAIDRGFFDENENRLFGKIPISLTEKTRPISSSGLPPVSCIKINLDKFAAFPKWKQEFAIRHECCHLLTTSSTLSRTLEELLQIYPLQYLRNIIRYRREFVAHICMLKRYPSDWLREPVRIPEKIMSPRTFYRKIKKEKGRRAAIEVAISNSLKVLSLIYICEYIVENVKDSIEVKTDLTRYNSYLQSWWHQVRKDTNNRIPIISNLIRRDDFLNEENYFEKVKKLLNLLDKIFPRVGIVSEGWNPSIANLAEAMELVETYFGKQWLNEQIAIQSRKPKDWRKKFTHHLTPGPHPILPLYLGAVNNLKQLKTDSNIGFEVKALELMSFSEVLKEVKKIDIMNINGKPLLIRPWSRFKTRLRNKDEFDQASYEMQIAVALKKSGFRVCFIQESTKKQEKTPDLLIREGKDAIYVECKYRTLTKRERQYNNMFTEFYWRSMRLMFRLGKFYSICVEWLKDPNIKYVESIIKWLDKKISNNEQGYFEIKNAKIWLGQLASKGQVFEGPFNFDISKYKSDGKHIDIMMQQAYAGIFNGIIKHKNPTFIMFRNISYLDTMVKGIVELLNKAYSQIPEKGTGIVFLEARLSFLNQRISESLEELQRKLEGKLNLIERVNMIILTRSYFSKKNMKINNRDAVVITRVVESRIIPDQKPASPISKGTLNKIRNLKYY